MNVFDRLSARFGSTPERAMLRRTMLDHTTPETTPWTMRPRLSYSEIEQAYLRDALVKRGIDKKSRDLFKKWHTLEPADESEKAANPATVKTLQAFVRRTHLRRIITLLVADVYLYGDGYVEIVYDGDETPNEAPPDMSRGIRELVLVNPATMRPVRDTNPASPTLGETLYFEQIVPGGGTSPSGSPLPKTNGIPTVTGPAIRFHPDRIRHLQFYNVGDEWRGVGSVEAAYNNVVAKFKADLALGDILSWYAKGFYVLNIEDANEEDIAEAYKMLSEARKNGLNYFAGSERHKFSIQNASVVDPQHILNSFHINIAASLDMPKDMLIGASAGAITGSETNLRDYYEDTAAILETYMTSFVENLYADELNVDIEDLDVRVEWNILYVNEQAQADTNFKSAQAASIAYRDGVITLNEYRSHMGMEPIDGGDTFYEPPATADIPASDGPGAIDSSASHGGTETAQHSPR